MPRTVNEQFRQGLDVGRNTLEAGDLVFFETETRGPSHVGLVVGGDEFVHAPSSRGDGYGSGCRRVLVGALRARAACDS